MNREQLLERLAYFLDPKNGIGAVLYFVINKDEEMLIRFADIEEEAKLELKDRFLSEIDEQLIRNEELEYRNISDADNRKNAIYRYDVEEKPQSLAILDEILASEEQETFKFSIDSLDNLQGYLITIGNETNKIALYKKHHAFNLLHQDRFLMVPISDQRFVKVKNDTLTIDKHFDFMLVDDNLIVLKLNTLERFFGYEEVIRHQAQNTIKQVETNQLLENIEQLYELAKTLPNARKLMQIGHSLVLNIPATAIIKFIRHHPELNGKINFNADETRIKLTTASSKKLFLKLLNDDYLFSKLTELQYDSYIKDQLKKPR